MSVISYLPHSVLSGDNMHDVPLLKKTTFQRVCKSLKRKIYILLLLIAVVLIWVFIYYKLLNHRFELPEPLQKLRLILGDGKVKIRQGRQDLTENIVTPSMPGRSCLKQFQTKRNSTILHIVIVAYGERVKQALVNMKTITLVSNCYIVFHVFTDDRNLKKLTFKKELESWPSFKQSQTMLYSLHRLHFPVRQNKVEWLHLFKVAAAQRLFIADILIDIDAILYVDTDLLFLRSPEDLWMEFNKFNDNQIAGLTYECQNKLGCWYPNHAKHPYYKPYGINSGVMLMNLTRMRHVQWESELINIYEQYRLTIPWGDQDILNIYFSQHPDRLFIFSCSWNYRPNFCVLGNTCADSAKNGIYVLHGNQGVFEKKTAQPEFYTIFQVFKEFDFQTSNFQMDITNKTNEQLNVEKFRNTGCGKMKIHILKHLKCYDIS